MLAVKCPECQVICVSAEIGWFDSPAIWALQGAVPRTGWTDQLGTLCNEMGLHVAWASFVVSV